eukprot:m51a1_g2223 hypothetical protein (343) ;mRNA; f:229005-230242
MIEQPPPSASPRFADDDETAPSTRDDRIFAAFQGPVLGLSSGVLHQHKTFTAELLVSSSWRASRSLEPPDVAGALLASRVCRPGSTAEAACPKCGRVVEVFPAPCLDAGDEELPAGLESYAVQLRARCTSSTRHLRCSMLVLAAELAPGLVVQSHPFSVYARKAGRQAKKRSGAVTSPSAEPPVQQQQQQEAAGDGVDAGQLVAALTPAELPLMTTTPLQTSYAAADFDTLFPSPVTDMRFLATKMRVVVRINAVKFCPEVGLLLMRGVVPVIRDRVPGFLLQKGSAYPGLLIVVWCYKTIEDAQKGMALQKQYATNKIKNPLDRNLVVDGLVVSLAEVTSW